MKKIVLSMLGLGVLGLACLFAGFWTSAPRHNITPESVEAVKRGMTEHEVEAIFRCPAGDFTGGRVIPVLFGHSPTRWGDTPKEWVSQEGGVRVWFDEDGRVKWTVPVVLFPSDTSWDRLLRWFGL